MFRLRRVFVLLAVLVALAVALSPAQAASGILQDNPDPSLWDAQGYAATVGVGLDEAIRRLQLQDVVGDLEAELSEKEAQTFAGLWIEHTPTFRVVVRFTRQPGQTMGRYLVAYPALADLVETRTARVSLADLQKAQDEALTSLRNAGIPLESGINVFDNRVELYVAEANRLQFDAAMQGKTLRLADSVQVIAIKALGKTDADIYGGLPLSSCTSGFAVKKSDGTKGITTAGHCGNSLSYNGTSLTFKGEKYETYYDIQWHTASGYTVKNKIRWWSDGSTRDITATKSRSSQSIGNYVCKYGKETHYTCGYISDKNYQPTYVPSAQATFIRVDNTAGYPVLRGPGDSGGPWFLTSTAYGTHSGAPGADPNDAIYMAINYVSGISVSVMTAP